jgi:D-serine deaminase-like pyridoxal phosphate-dependent protein
MVSAEYFHNISQALKNSGTFKPTLVLDKTRLDQNLDHLLAVIQRGFDYRIVAKSLPSIPLLEYIMQRSGSNRLMSFHLPFLFHVVKHLPQSDVLLGKPMPVAAARQFYQWHQSLDNSTFSPQKQLHWLVDSLERLQQYQVLAKELNCNLNINLEIDVGLHRGGFSNNDELRKSLLLLKDNPQLKLSGLMGYEAHVTKIPKIIAGRKKTFTAAIARYKHCVDTVVDILGAEALKPLILNAGGSSTYPLYYKSDHQTHSQSDFITEIATASALVKPTDFDVDTLEHHSPAAFIAAPVLKIVYNPVIPMAAGLSKLMHKVGLLPKKACFIYGGNWLASPYFPSKTKRANIFGQSSNQEMYEIAEDSELAIDDFIYFRPSQSEAVFLQFGEIAVYENGKIIDWWPVFEAENTSNYPTNNKKPNIKLA